MNEFPKLRTGAVLQYPAERTSRFGTFVTRFLDGTEQRFAESREPVRFWAIRLNLLTDDEVLRLQNFFLEQQGSASGFHFVDPWSGNEYENCFCADPTFLWQWLEEDRSQAQLLIRSGGRTA